ncbi:helix-turn-helix transcriptional regulator [Nocardioides stalactiti]|uniref:helix-turn-helix transcriptional regulator n=1 Tax=Nocardioides stalactiti TaxID=2755356 RepID=UPI0016039429|nr:helix-turn-helix transcriptional regulator [Nocardioides stalactiti]
MTDHERHLADLADVARSGLDLVTLWREATPVLAKAVPHFQSPCFFTVDPSSMLTTSHFQEGFGEIPTEWLAKEFEAPDFNSLTEVLRSPSGVGTLADATDGQPERAPKFHEEMQPYGCEQELAFALRTTRRESWGAVSLYREQGRPQFTEADKAFAGAAGRILADGVRFALLLAQGTEPDLPDPPGVLLLDEDLRSTSATPPAVEWLRDLDGTVERLPAVVAAVAGAAVAREGEASAHVRSARGTWVVVHGSRLAPSREVAVVLSAADPTHLAPLLMRAHGLTDRERQLVHRVLTGASTTVIARDLAIAEDTVQQHLSSVFNKTGTRSRGELVGLLFRHHYEPRVRDNEVRTTTARPVRNGPMAAPGT